MNSTFASDYLTYMNYLLYSYCQEYPLGTSGGNACGCVDARGSRRVIAPMEWSDYE
jgi:hypothetical protein